MTKQNLFMQTAQLSFQSFQVFKAKKPSCCSAMMSPKETVSLYSTSRGENDWNQSKQEYFRAYSLSKTSSGLKMSKTFCRAAPSNLHQRHFDQPGITSEEFSFLIRQRNENLLFLLQLNHHVLELEKITSTLKGHNKQKLMSKAHSGKNQPETCCKYCQVFSTVTMSSVLPSFHR